MNVRLSVHPLDGPAPQEEDRRMASAYSPIVTDNGGAVRVVLSDDHPGVTDPAYRARRDALAALAATWAPGRPLPEPEYTDVEHGVWRTVVAELRRRHRQHATRRFLDSAERLGLPAEHVPQLGEVSAGLASAGGFRYQPVAGLAPLRDFYGDFAGDVFWSTQYLRHPSAPLYTPEPDLVHEVIGHANQLADPEIAELYRCVGRTVRRLETDTALRVLSKVFWFTVEFGVVVEDGEPKAFGAGLLSSVGELDAYRGATIVDADLTAMAATDYDITHFQPVLYSFPSDVALLDGLRGWLDDLDDDRAAGLVGAGSPALTSPP
jgi:phenylalanine-4-hydroxylase